MYNDTVMQSKIINQEEDTMIFDVSFEDGYFSAAARNELIFTQGKTMDELFKNIGEAVSLYLEEQKQTSLVPTIRINADVVLPSVYA